MVESGMAVSWLGILILGVIGFIVVAVAVALIVGIVLLVRRKGGASQLPETDLSVLRSIEEGIARMDERVRNLEVILLGAGEAPAAGPTGEED
jgi:phage shock protein B